jgi:tetratricopeptide (TPR) repeat protein
MANEGILLTCKGIGKEASRLLFPVFPVVLHLPPLMFSFILKGFLFVAFAALTFLWPGTAVIFAQPQASNAVTPLQRHLEAARKAQAAQDFTLAVEEYKKALNLKPVGAAEIYQNLGLVYHLQFKYQEAIQSFEKALGLQPKLWASHLFLGIGLYKTNQFSRALSPLRKALDLDPKNAELEGRFWLGVTQLALHQYPEAIGELERRLERTPKDIEVLYNLLQAHNHYSAELLKQTSGEADPAYTQGKYHAERAAKILRSVSEIDPNSYRLHQMEGEVLEQQEQYPKAIESYKGVYAIKPDLPGIRFAIGSVYWKMRQFDEATRWLQGELKANPHHAIANYELGNIYVYRNKASQAIPHLRETIFAQPQFMDAHRDLGKALLQLEKYDEALDHLRLVAQAEPEDDAIHALLASAYRKQGKLEEERVELKLFQELNRKKLERAQRRVQKAQ